MSRPVDSLIEYLVAEKARGTSHVYLDDGARAGLRALFLQSRKPAKVIPPPDEAPQSPTAAPLPSLSGETKAEKLAGLRTQAASWPATLALGSLREKMVFACGNPDADLMLIGEAPGYNEEKEGEPFAGPAGQKLNDILKAMGIRREEVYISNLVKFRPSLPRQTTNNRKPTAEEMAAFLPLLKAEISVVQPKVIMALGVTAAEGLMGSEGNIGSLRGIWHEIAGIPTRVTYHPSYLLQSGGSHEIKRALWEDMLAAMEKLGMPISEKQKSYFLPKS